jgi:FdhD protein
VIPRMVSITGVKEWREGALRPCDDYLAGEEPLEICVGGEPLTVTMRTPGHDEELALGFLLTEGLIDSRAAIASVRRDSEADGGNRVHVELVAGALSDARAHQRNFYAASSCGICGKASIDAIRLQNIRAPLCECAVDPEVLCGLPDRLRAAQPVFGRTGGLHAAALFSLTGELLALREDIGRHNAVDKIVGWALANNLLPLSDRLLMVSGRGGFEIVQKALAAGVPVLASISAPSDLAVKLSREFGMTLIGFLRGRRFVIYSGEARLAAAALRLAS